MQAKLDALQGLKVFQPLPRGQGAPQDFKKIPLLWVFTVKPNGTHKARCAVGGHQTEDPTSENVYVSVIKITNVRLVFLFVILNKLDVLTGDIKNAYLYAKTKEKVYIVAGEEFGPLQGQVLIIKGVWYGLKTSGNCFHAHLSDNLWKEDFKLSKPDECIWLKAREDHYDYLLTHVDDLKIALRVAKEIMKNLQEIYVIKKVRPPS